MTREKRIDFVGRLDARTVLGDGSVRFSARLTRVGVFDYGDHKELRTADEVFKQAALESFKGLAVSEGHKAWLDADNWREHAIGHVGDDVKQDGEFVVASLIVKDRAALAKIDNDELIEISMGYSVDLDASPGVTPAGEKYDSIQRNIQGNHAALGPANWGRAGSSVRLLDGAAYAADMTTPAQRIDAPAASNTDAADLAASRADNEAIRKERDTARADLAAEKKRADVAEAERDTARKEAADAKTEAAKVKTDSSTNIDARVETRIALVDSARTVLDKDFIYGGKSDKDVRLAVLAKVDPELKLDGKSDDYIAARFDGAVATVKTDRIALGEVNETTTKPKGTEGETKSILDQAHERAEAERIEAAKGGAPAIAGFSRK